MSNKSDQYVFYLKQCFLSLYCKKITVRLEVSVEFHETYKIPKQFHHKKKRKMMNQEGAYKIYIKLRSNLLQALKRESFKVLGSRQRNP